MGKKTTTHAHWFKWQKWGPWAGASVTGLSLIIVGVIVYQERSELIQYVQTAHVTRLLWALIWYTIDLAIYVVAWASIMNKLENKINFLDHARIFCLSNASRRLPGTLWYIGGRAVLYRGAGISGRSVAVASGLEAILAWLSGVLVAIPLWIAKRADIGWMWAGIGAALLLLVSTPWALRWITNRITEKGANLLVSLQDMCLWIALYAAGWVVGGILLFSVLTTFQPLPIEHLPTIVGIWSLSGGLSMLTIVFPSSLGVMEITLTALLSSVVPTGWAVLAAISMRGLTTVLDLFWASVGALLRWILPTRLTPS